jgi:hypothetical protein
MRSWIGSWKKRDVSTGTSELRSEGDDARPSIVSAIALAPGIVSARGRILR